MVRQPFSLKERDRARLVKDRVVRFAVTCGGVSVLGALVLIFIYLAMVVVPLFGDAKWRGDIAVKTVSTTDPLLMTIGAYGENAFLMSNDGVGQFWSLRSASDQPIQTQSLGFTPVLWAQTPAAQGWFALVGQDNQVAVVHPQLSHSMTAQGREFTPSLERLALPEAFRLSELPLQQFAFALTAEALIFATYDNAQQIQILRLDRATQQEISRLSLSVPFRDLSQLLLTLDGKTLYLRTRSELVVALLDKQGYQIREIVDLSEGDSRHQVTQLYLLSGAFSLLAVHEDGLVSQWFDVLRDGQRHLTHIRNFKLASEVQFLLPDTNTKGFYSFYRNGTLQSHYTTSEKLVLFERAYQRAPQLVAMSENQAYLASYDQGKIQLAQVENRNPEVSFSALWQKVWYESYPEPEFVWQSTAATDDFEAKFSLVPIAFGTLKAAAFAMLFAMPIAVLGAIYTAYFMTPSMRRVVKPTIELMEALPTVIIGFLAGLWFAPFVESHLPAVLALMILLPPSTIVLGFIWSRLPKAWLRRIPSGWHVLILIPVLIGISALILSYSGELENALFAGDLRVYLAQHGIGYDQRNALVVGFAMGFAVIPTIFTIAEDAIFSVPKHLSDGSLALGATPWQTLIYVVLLTASPGIFSAIMMGLGRAVGETMIVLMATGNTPLLDWNIFEGMRTLSATIAVELPESEVQSAHFRILFLAALLLLTFTFAVNSLAEWVRQRLREKYRSL
ncbi:Phosphate transport system permease protein PstC 1 [Vibrio cholerae]|uniref:ABC transporter permease subunit n=1 Tax=Vibrio cholerae TaxID=666 RepID=UPI0016687CDE|nr:ABC transporter permease subunit [Vibrio cholerae]GFK34175.1 Phosphate transport system permease protein PstC 1 [Vibrio cholerae]GFK37621.1 Phosphate transport system permease protein PstC 1 [Vibrio cholerae]GFK41081.1 Phosphate transport system permease protein PstC 1 [Vibrio cholerae]GFK47761.1 Phosphate transport system permease protein PstC 1 [Vibrio cholerae]GFK51638.1 Phosphate transport system permease protein PstC 1 [Vibrio cholerae]